MNKVFMLLLLVLASLSLSAAFPPKIVNPFKCKAGQTYNLDCNSCICPGEGAKGGLCTFMACNLREDECIPYTYFEIEGELCPCPTTGYKWDSSCFGSAGRR